jgi:hypothetical protein
MVDTMHIANIAWRYARSLGPIFLVAIGVAFASTLAGSIFDHAHQVDAEEISGAREYPASPGPNGTQVLGVTTWNVRLTLPLAHEMPMLSYYPQSTGSMGLTSADLSALSPACSAAHNGLGSLVRFQAGSYIDAIHNNGTYSYIATIGGYDYAYLAPQGDCAAAPGAGATINREEAILLGSIDSLSAL